MAISQWCRLRTIGHGSTATVSLAMTYPSGHLFSVKSSELSLSALVRREQAILSSLHHPNIVSCLGFNVAAEAPHGRVFYHLFLEYAPGGSLSDCMKKHGGLLEEAVIRSYTHDILHGLAHLHAMFVAHCDVKSQNVLIWPEGRAKIADLGCARSAAGDDDARWPIMGTPMFMAPEVARGEEQGAPADIWSLGCTVIEMATGRPPWPDAVDPVAALHRVGFSSDVPNRPGWLSEPGKDFLDKCLRRDPRERWTAEQLLEHPFVAKTSPADCCFLESSSNQVVVSPKSTLEQGLWDPVAEEEEGEEVARRSDSLAARMLQLAGDGFPAIDWRWDDNWITVRSSEEESAYATVHDDDELNTNSIIDHITSEAKHGVPESNHSRGRSLPRPLVSLNTEPHGRREPASASATAPASDSSHRDILLEEIRFLKEERSSLQHDLFDAREKLAAVESEHVAKIKDLNSSAKHPEEAVTALEKKAKDAAEEHKRNVEEQFSAVGTAIARFVQLTIELKSDADRSARFPTLGAIGFAGVAAAMMLLRNLVRRR
ncbi:mitogen-activated protein kinase kinase kinase 18-like [Musa acuminata AAA Group]|uniref:mitogen-activated protein kinase kinase kinase 18-like n=1 Tax=Musa acuminata AAA Group TaxID=214697 RepID=UPI0031DAFD7F